MIRLLLIVVIQAFVLALPALAQLEVEWVKFGLTSSQLISTQDDGFILYGWYREPFDVDGDHVVDFDTLGGSDAFMARLDQYGELLWTRRAGGREPSPVVGRHVMATDVANTLAEHSNGHLYLAGRFAKEIDFNEDGHPELTSSDSLEAFVAQYNADGSFNWATALPLLDDEITSILIDEKKEALYIVGRNQEIVDNETEGTSTNYTSGFYARLSLSGELVWIQTPVIDYEVGYPVFDIGIPVLGSDGEVYIPGTFRSRIDLDGNGPHPPIENPNLSIGGFLMKLTPEGELVWVRTAHPFFASSLTGFWFSKAVEQHESIIVTGRKAQGEARFQGIDSTVTVASTGAIEYMMASYSKGGQIEWAYTTQSTLETIPTFEVSLSHTVGHTLEVDDRGHLWLIGTSRGAVDFDGDTQSDISSSVQIPFIAAYNDDGRILTLSTPRDSAQTLSSAWLNAAVTSNGLFVNGVLIGNVDLDEEGPFSPLYLQDRTQVLVKYRFDNNSVLQQERDAPSTDVPALLSLSAPFPNPMRTDAQLTIQTAITQPVRIQLHDVLGREVAVLLDETVPAHTPTKVSIEANILPSGLYLIRAIGAEHVSTQSILIAR